MLSNIKIIICYKNKILIRKIIVFDSFIKNFYLYINIYINYKSRY